MLVFSVLLKIFRANLNAHLHAQIDISWFKTVFLNIVWGLLTPSRSSWEQQLFFQEIYTCIYKHTSCTQFQLFYGSLRSVHGSVDSGLNTMLCRAPWFGMKIHKYSKWNHLLHIAIWQYAHQSCIYLSWCYLVQFQCFQRAYTEYSLWSMTNTLRFTNGYLS